MTLLRTLAALARAAARRAWSVLRPVLAVVSPVGWVVAAVALAAVVTAALLGWPEFLYLGLTLAAALVVAVLFLLGRARYRVLVELQPRRVVAGERAFGRLVVANAGSGRSAASRLDLPVGRGRAEFVVPALPAGGEHEELFAVPTERRAVIVAGPAESVRGDALGLVRRTVRWADPVELFVHPRTVRLAPSASGLVRDLEGETTRTITDDDLAFHALRPYEPGDDRRRVHWRTTARTGTLMVRQFQETRRSEMLLVQLTDRAGYAGGDEFELAVSITASIGAQVLREGTRLHVASDRLRLRTATRETLLDDCSRLEPLDLGAPAAREVVRAATRRLAAPSVLVVVAGSATPLAELRAIGTLYRGDTRVVVLRAEVGAEPRVGVVADLRTVTIGALAELPRMLRRTT